MLRDPAYARRNNKSLEAASNEEIRKTAEQMLAKVKAIKKDPKKAAAEMDRQTIENLTNWITSNHGHTPSLIYRRPVGRIHVAQLKLSSLRGHRLTHCGTARRVQKMVAPD